MPKPKHAKNWDWTKPRQADRKKKMVAVTLSDDERAILDRFAEEGFAKSAVVGAALRLFRQASKKAQTQALLDGDSA